MFKNKRYILIFFILLILFLFSFYKNNYTNKIDQLENYSNKIDFKNTVKGNFFYTLINENNLNKNIEINSNDFVNYRYLRIKLKKNIFNNIPLYFEYENLDNKEEKLFQKHSHEIFVKFTDDEIYKNLFIKIYDFQIGDEKIVFKNIFGPRIFKDSILEIHDVTSKIKESQIFPFSYYYKSYNEFMSNLKTSIININDSYEKKIIINNMSNKIIKKNYNDDYFLKSNFFNTSFSEVIFTNVYDSEIFPLKKNQYLKFEFNNLYGNIIMDIYYDNNLVNRVVENSKNNKLNYKIKKDGLYNFKFYVVTDKYNFSEIDFKIYNIYIYQ